MLLALCLSAVTAAAPLAFTVENLRTEYMENPLGLDTPRPRFSYALHATTRDLRQLSYRILVGDGTADGSVWDSGVVRTNVSIQIPYGGPALTSNTVYHWAVEVSAVSGGHTHPVSNTSATALFSTGFFERSEWSGEFIGLEDAAGRAANRECPWFRKRFVLPEAAIADGRAALLSVASVGYHEVQVNSQPASDYVLLPSISHLPNRVLYRTYNVTGLLRPGEVNVVGIWACVGWDNYGDMSPNPGVLVLAELHAGSSFKLVTDSSWKVHESTVSHIGSGFGGDALNDSKAIPLWSSPLLDDSGWTAPTVGNVSADVRLSADTMEGSRRHTAVSARRITQAGGGPAPPPTTAACGHDCACGMAAEPTKGQPLKDATSFTLTCASKTETIGDVSFASFGMPTGTCGHFQINPKCNANTTLTLATIRKLCVGKNSCTVRADRNLFGPDPCPGTAKHLWVEASGCDFAPPPPPTPPPVSFVVEMDELYTGWFEVSNLQGAPLSTITFQVSTTSGEAIEYGMEDQFTFGESGRGHFRMRFQYHEIHFITITGLQTQPRLEDVGGWKLTSLGERTGDFSCSNPLITKMYGQTVRNYEGLTTGGMTVDCPHRERRGYGGDGHTSYQFALANYPVGAYFNKWLRDFSDIQCGVAGATPLCQNPDLKGWVPHTAPTVSGGGGPAWSGFVVTNPWQTYNTFGDEQILRNMFPTMKGLLEFYSRKTNSSCGLLYPWSTSMWDFLGDWITPHGNEQKNFSPENLLFNNCYCASPPTRNSTPPPPASPLIAPLPLSTDHYILKITSKIAGILGDRTAEAEYTATAASLAVAIERAFGDANTGVYLDRLQTHAVMPLASGVVPAAVAPKTIQNLQNQIEVVDTGHLDTGLTGTYFMVKFLMESGRNDLIFAFANTTSYPGYGYFIEQNFTTWPERWSSAGGAASHDSKMHGCYNGIGLWFVEGIAGIRVHFSEVYPVTIRAGVDAGDISAAQGQRVALHGLAKSAWAATATGFVHNITMPQNGVAKVLIPSTNGASGVTESGTAVADASGVTVLGGTETINRVEYVALEVRGGSYSFRSGWIKK